MPVTSRPPCLPPPGVLLPHRSRPEHPRPLPDHPPAVTAAAAPVTPPEDHPAMLTRPPAAPEPGVPGTRMQDHRQPERGEQAQRGEDQAQHTPGTPPEQQHKGGNDSEMTLTHTLKVTLERQSVHTPGGGSEALEFIEVLPHGPEHVGHEVAGVVD